VRVLYFFLSGAKWCVSELDFLVFFVYFQQVTFSFVVSGSVNQALRLDVFWTI